MKRTLITHIAEALMGGADDVDALIQQHIDDFNLTTTLSEWKIKHHFVLRRWCSPQTYVEDYEEKAQKAKERFPAYIGEFDRTPEEERATQKVVIRKSYASQIVSITAPYSKEETATWFIQVEEANAYLADNNAETPMLTAMATAREISLLELVTKIKENDTTFRAAIGTLLGRQQKEIDSLQNEE